MVAPIDDPNAEETLERFHRIVDLMKMVPGMGDVHKDLADIYEKAKAQYDRHHKIDREPPERRG